MVTFTSYGKYLLHYKSVENVWIMEYLGPDEEKTDKAAPCIVSIVPYSHGIFVTELVATDPVSAFARGANNIIKYREALVNETT
jgi:hypothetical protein